MTKTGTLTNKETGKETDYYMNMTGVGARHMGVELELKSEPLTWLSLNGMLSIGNWEWDNNATGYAYNDAGQPLTSKVALRSAILNRYDAFISKWLAAGISQGASTLFTY